MKQTIVKTIPESFIQGVVKCNKISLARKQTAHASTTPLLKNLAAISSYTRGVDANPELIA